MPGRLLKHTPFGPLLEVVFRVAVDSGYIAPHLTVDEKVRAVADAINTAPGLTVIDPTEPDTGLLALRDQLAACTSETRCPHETWPDCIGAALARLESLTPGVA